MNAVAKVQVVKHYLDAGPLFCLGSSEVLADLFDVHWLGESNVVAAVVSEIGRNADLVLPAVGPNDKRDLKKSARVVRGRYKTLLASAKQVPTPEPEALSVMNDELCERDQDETGVSGNAHPRKNDGEVESVYWAIADSAQLVSNDKHAHYLACKYGVISLNFVEVTRRLIGGQKLVSRRAAYKEIVGLARRKIYPGEHVAGVLDLA
ncbi:MAG: hypothetical protein L0K07_06690 [Yaniella sp.]|nr:hypothetical protein [Yaniella sp.]